jgi:hypothetical protein
MDGRGSGGSVRNLGYQVLKNVGRYERSCGVYPGTLVALDYLQRS